MTSQAAPPPPLLSVGDTVRGWQIKRQLEAADMVSQGQPYRVERYAAQKGQASQTLRVISPIPPTLSQEREWLKEPREPAFETWLEGWADTKAAYDIFAPQPGQTLAQFQREHPPLSPEDSRLLLLSSLKAVVQLQRAGLHLPHLSAHNIWLEAGGGVGLRELWSALGSGTNAADLKALAEATAPALTHQQTALAEVLADWRQQRGASDAAAAQRALQAVAPVEEMSPEVSPAPPPAASPTTTGSVRWLWLIPVALLAGSAALFWPQIKTAAQQHPLLGGRLGGNTSSPASPTPSTPPTQPASSANSSQPLAQPTQASAQRVMVNTNALNLRPTPDTNGAPLGQLSGRQVVTVLGRRNGWLKVEATEGLRGWVSEEFTLPVLAPAEVDALRQAAQGHRSVTLARGVYLLEKPLELEWNTRLVGQGVEETFLMGSGATDASGGATILTRDAALELQNLSVVWQSNEAGQPLRMERGSLKANNVRFTGGVARLDNRKVGSGAWLRSGATAAIVGSRFEQNAMGLSLTGNSSAYAEDSRFGDNLYAGVFWDSGGGMLRGNRLEANGEVGAMIGGTATPTLSNNAVRRNAQSGIEILGAAAPVLEGNQLERLGLRGILLGGASRAVLRSNQITGGSEAGLWYQGSAQGSAESNQIVGARIGIRLSEQAAPELRSNSVSGSLSAGLSYGGQAGGAAINNRVTGAGAGGIYVSGEASPTLEGNEVSGSAESGLVLLDKANSHVLRNTLRGNRQHGVRVSGEATPRLEGNAALDNGGYGLVWTDAAGGSAQRNLCQDNRLGPALVTAAAHPNVVGDPCLEQTAETASEQVPPTSPLPAPTPLPPAETLPAETSPAEPAAAEPLE